MKILPQEPFLKYYRGSALIMDRLLSSSEMATVMFLSDLVCYTDCVLRTNGSAKGTPLTIQDIANLRGMKYDTLRKIMYSLRDKEIIGFHITGEGCNHKWITLNPFVFCRGTKVASWVYDFYKDSKWAKFHMSYGPSVFAEGEEVEQEKLEELDIDIFFDDILNRQRTVFKSKLESKCASILNNLKIKYDTQHTFDACVYKKKLRFDFYFIFNGKEYCIETDGIQHEKPIPKFGGLEGFLETQTRDEIKNKYCEENGIILIRIPEKEYQNMEYIITKALGIEYDI